VAISAIWSAVMFGLGVFGIKLLLHRGGLPRRNQVKVFSEGVALLVDDVDLIENFGGLIKTDSLPGQDGFALG
jgi:hypothetical protein